MQSYLCTFYVTVGRVKKVFADVVLFVCLLFFLFSLILECQLNPIGKEYINKCMSIWTHYLLQQSIEVSHRVHIVL